MIGVGDEVVCVRSPGADHDLLPHDRPVVGEVYTITSIYSKFYGLGCTLEGLDPTPYQGYFLRMADNSRFPDAELGWYFEKLVKLDLKKFTRVHDLVE